MKYMQVSGMSYTAWIDDSESDFLVAGVFEIPGFPIIRQPRSVHASWLLAEALDQEVQKYLNLCRKLGWPPVKRDPVADRRHDYDSPAAQAAVAAVRELAKECAAQVGDEGIGARLALAIVGLQVDPLQALPNKQL